jgi:translation initiation factor 2A
MWSMDETTCVRMTNNGVQAINGTTFEMEQQNGRLENSKVDAISMSPNLPPYVAVFTKQSKGQPAHVVVYKAPNLSNEVVQKSMFKADTCEMFWNNPGTALIANCRTDQDSTGQSYYGDSLVYLVLPKQKETMNVTVGRGGEQVHDVAWAPPRIALLFAYSCDLLNFI